MKKFAVCLGVFWGVLNTSPVLAQQSIQNPLVRPPGLGASAPNGQPNEAGGAASASNAPGGSGAAAAANAANKADDLREKAGNRLSQEDFNLRQQALNSTVVPTPLQNLFSSMTAIATVSGQIVFRRLENAAGIAQPGQTANSGPIQAGGANIQPNVAPRTNATTMTQYNPALRMRLGKPINLNGYTVRARMDGLDVTVEWQDEKKEWITVFFGAVESISTSNTSLAGIELEKIDSRSFDYLVPKVSSRISTSSGGGQSGGGNNQPAGNFGSGGGGNSSGGGGTQNGQIGF